MNYKLVNFRGDSEGIIIGIKAGELNAIIQDMESKLNESKEFFKGAKIKSISGEDLTPEKLKCIENLLVEKYNMVMADLKPTKKARLGFKKRKLKPKPRVEMPFGGINEGKTKFIKTTVRSGQVVEFDGNVVVLGDVNPGGIIAAKGNIVVLGTLKGIAKAGVDGNREAIIAAFSLEPTQLKIAEIMSRRPDEAVEKSDWPEIAKIQDDMIIIESYAIKTGNL